MSHTAVCVAPASAQATAIIHDLRQAGFTAEEIAIVNPGSNPLARLRHDLVIGVGVGAALAGLAAWSPLAVPCLGSPLLDMLCGGLLGALLACARLSRNRSDNRVLISVQTANGYEVETIVDIFRAAGAAHRTWSSPPLHAA